MNKNCFSNLKDACGAIRVNLVDGKGKGMDILIVNNGCLTLHIALDRAMDIVRLEHRGENIAFITKNGYVSPAYLGSEGNSYASTFQGGFLLTCGLDNVMGPDVHNGKHVVQHGSLTYIPATDIKYETVEKDGKLFVIVSGTMEYTSLFGNNLKLKRTITLEYLKDEFSLKDEILNDSTSNDEYMIMYHHNLGYPVLNKDTILDVDTKNIEMISKDGTINDYQVFLEPSPKKPEQVYIHTVNDGDKVHVTAKGGNHEVSISWDNKVLPYMLEWQSFADNDYALGLEPAMSPYPKKIYKQISPKETHTYKLHYSFK